MEIDKLLDKLGKHTDALGELTKALLRHSVALAKATDVRITALENAIKRVDPGTDLAVGKVVASPVTLFWLLATVVVVFAGGVWVGLKL